MRLVDHLEITADELNKLSEHIKKLSSDRLAYDGFEVVHDVLSTLLLSTTNTNTIVNIVYYVKLPLSYIVEQLDQIRKENIKCEES